eukprot:m.27511 g.27511  ORF g.27511 m.27511 type:complete len:78 (-) comp13429_c1_seq3:2156-2389(-)
MPPVNHTTPPGACLLTRDVSLMVNMCSSSDINTVCNGDYSNCGISKVTNPQLPPSTPHKCATPHSTTTTSARKQHAT